MITEKQKLTERQSEYYSAILDYWRRNLRPPTIMDIADELDVTLFTAYELIERLEKKGWLEKAPRAARTIKPKDLRIHYSEDGSVALMWGVDIKTVDTTC